MQETVELNPAYSSNEGGHLAWDLALAIRAAGAAWRVGGNKQHLQHLLTWSERLCTSTDEARGALDWRGQSRPVWSAGRRYTAGKAELSLGDGTPLQLQAVADFIEVERPTPQTAVVRAVRGEREDWTSPELSVSPMDPRYLPDELSRATGPYSVLLHGLSEARDLSTLPAGRHVLEEQHAPHLVHTGLIARALLEAAEILDRLEGPLPQSNVTPSELRSLAERALISHDAEATFTSGDLWYSTPLDFPTRRLGLELPHNHVVDVASSFLILGRHKHSTGLFEMGSSLTHSFLNELTAHADGLVDHPWNYYPSGSKSFKGVVREFPLAERAVPAASRGEDSSHATMRVRALLDWKFIDEALVPDRLLAAAARTLRECFLSRADKHPTLLLLPGSDASSPRTGQANSYAGAWGGLSAWDASVGNDLNTLAWLYPPNSAFGATLLSAAEILVTNSPLPWSLFSDCIARG